ncbi:hypothetical protein [Klebsiella pneumoniae]
MQLRETTLDPNTRRRAAGPP